MVMLFVAMSRLEYGWAAGAIGLPSVSSVCPGAQGRKLLFRTRRLRGAICWSGENGDFTGRRPVRNTKSGAEYQNQPIE